jgi:hypothetical protein
MVGRLSTDITPLLDIIENNRVVAYFKNRGYKYLHFGPELLPTTNNKYADFNYIYPGNKLTLTPFSALLFEQTVFHPIASQISKQASSLNIDYVDDTSRYTKYNMQFDQTREVAQTTRMAGPKFIFFHSLLTHTPFVIDADGRYVPESVELSRTWNENYINQLKFTNVLLKQMIQAILNDSKTQPIIILQSDEGPYPARFIEAIEKNIPFDWRYATRDELKEKLGILNAYYLPKVDDRILYPTITPVNSFRIVLNEYFGEKLPLLEDRNYVHEYAHPYDVFDATNLLGK